MVMGRPRKPSEVKKAEGNRRKLGRDQITTDPRGVGRPSMPAELSADAQACWAAVVRSLPKGILSAADDGALEVYADAWARYRQAKRMVLQTGLLVQSPQGPIRNPMLIVQERAASEMGRFGAELGLSPVARARLSANDPTGEEDPLALLLGDDGEDGAWSTAPRTRQ